MQTRNNARKTSSEIDDKNQIEEQFMSSQAFHWTPAGCIQKITAEVQCRLENLELFNPITLREWPAYSCNDSQPIDNLKHTSIEIDQRQWHPTRIGHRSNAEISRRDWRRIGHEHQRECYPSENQIEAGSPAPGESLPEQSAGASRNEQKKKLGKTCARAERRNQVKNWHNQLPAVGGLVHVRRSPDHDNKTENMTIGELVTDALLANQSWGKPCDSERKSQNENSNYENLTKTDRRITRPGQENGATKKNRGGGKIKSPSRRLRPGAHSGKWGLLKVGPRTCALDLSWQTKIGRENPAPINQDARDGERKRRPSREIDKSESARAS
jgi:hypothetical protein